MSGSDIQFNSCTWVPSEVIRSYADDLMILKWAIQFSQIRRGWLALRPFDCSRAELRTLSDSVTGISDLKHDFHVNLSSRVKSGFQTKRNIQGPKNW